MKNGEISLKASLRMILSSKGITKVLISLRGCAGWSALCSQTPEDRFCHDEAHMINFVNPPQTLFVVGILFSRCPSVRPSVTCCFLIS